MNSDFKQVTFGNGNAYKLYNTRIRDRLIDRLEKYYHLTLFKPFGKTYTYAQHEDDVRDVISYEHLANYKIHSPMVYMFLTEYNNLPLCCYIQQTLPLPPTIISCIQRFDRDLFKKDTLFEGYLLSDIFLVEDIVIHQGHTVTINLENRIKLINDILDYKYQPDTVLDPYRVILKDYVEYKYLDSFYGDYKDSLPYRKDIEGVIFSPLGKCVVNIIVDTETKMKFIPDVKVTTVNVDRCELIENPKKTSACFTVKPTDKPDVYELYLEDHGRLKYYDIARVPDKSTSCMLNKVFKENRGKELIMICVYDNCSHVQRWTPSMVSNRKTPDSRELLSQ